MSNLHSEQTGLQLHKPKKHSEAVNSSILAKTKDGMVGYVMGAKTYSTVITPIADVAGSTNNKYFSLYSEMMGTRYCVYYSVDGAGSVTLPDYYDELIKVSILGNATVETIIDETITALAAIDSTADHKLYTSATDNTTNLTIVEENKPVMIDVSTGWIFATTITDADTGVKRYCVTEDGVIKFVELVSSGGTPEGTAILSTGEEGGTKFLREDGDGTCSWQTPADLVGVNSIKLYDGSAYTDIGTGNVGFTLAGGTGISTVAEGTTITISETVEKKSKSDVEDVIGVTGTDLGTFTGSTIPDSRDIKTALQDLETTVETKANSGVSYHHKSLRYSANNLNGTDNAEGTNPAWGFAETNNNAHNRFFTAVDTSAMTYQNGLKSCIALPITGVTSKLIGGSLVGSGESGVTFKITIWKGDFDSSDEVMPMTLIGTFTVVGSNNADTDAFNIALGSSADCTLADGDGVIILMEDIEEQSDMDARGTVTLRFSDSF